MSLSPARFRSLFPIAKQHAYLDHAAIAPLADPVRDAMADFWQRQSTEPFDPTYWDERLSETRTRLAAFLRTSPDRIAFTRNTTHGLALVAAGLDWRAGDNVVSAQGEFPANVYPWMGLRTIGVELRLHPPVDGRIDPAALIDLCDARTRLVTISWVQFWSGYRIDIEALGSRLRRRDCFLVVDAMQAVGGLAADLSTFPVDFFCAGAPKWMLGPIGVGFAYIGERLFDRLRPTSVGTASVVRDHEYFDYDLTLKPDARRFEDSAQNVPGILGMGTAVELFLQAGPRVVEATILDLADRLRAELPPRGYPLVFTPRSPEERSGIVSFRSRRQPPAAVHAALREAGVIVSLRGDFLRASPHCYNNDADIDRLLEALPA